MKDLLSGNAAVARGAYEAGVTFATGYPGTPSSEILAHFAECEDVHAEWAPNEKTALEAAQGAGLAGARALVTMKHVGLNVAADPLFTAAYTGVGGGLVVVSADDPGMHSSQNEQDNRHYARAAKLPMLEPADSQEALDFTREAYRISERFDVPVLLRMTTRISHSASVVRTRRRVKRPAVGTPAPDPQKYVMIPAYARRRHAFAERRMERLQAFAEQTKLNQLIPGDKNLGIISAGVAFQYAREAFPRASFLKLGLSYPLPEKLIKKFARQVGRLYVVEELDPFLEEQIKALGVKLRRKKVSTILGELNPDRVAQALGRKSQPARPPLQGLPQRPPLLCPGCPHRPIYVELRRLKAFVTGDIGCYTLGTLPPLEALHTCVCMGAGIGHAHGLVKAGADPSKIVAVIGDSTFVHSGITGLVNMAYNQGAGTVIILDNSTTAMTGGQVHPGVGRTLEGQETAQVDYVKLAQAVGIRRARAVDPYNLAETRRALEEELAAPEPSLIVAQRPCILLTKRVSEPRTINEDECVACFRCLQIGCPAIIAPPGLEKGKAPHIDPQLCVGCTVCAQVCPKNAIHSLGSDEGPWHEKRPL